VSGKPCWSSARRIAPTLPSIMSLGATTSAPAAACDTAVLANSSNVASLSTTPFRTMPQWPCEVYSQRQTSVITTRSGAARFMARTVSWMIPCSSYAPLPCSSLAGGNPNSNTPPTPRSAARRASSPASASGCCITPGMAATGVAAPAGLKKSGQTSCERCKRASATNRRSPGLRRSRRNRTAGNPLMLDPSW